MSKVLVLDGKSIATVAIVRSLGKKGLEVDCGEEYKACPGSLSKYVKKKVVYPPPDKEPDLFIEKIFSLVREQQYDLVVPVSDSTTVLLSKYKTELSKFTRIPTPDYQTVMMARDKSKTVKIAMKNGIPCPVTFFPDEQKLNGIMDKINYPVLIKPCESSGARGIRHVDSPDTLISEYSHVKELYGKAIIQEYIPSKEGRYLLHTLFNQSHKPVAVCVIQAIRCYPANGGPTAFGKTVVQEEVWKYGLELLRAMNWQGVAEVEFLVDERDNQPKLMEVNQRFGNPVGLAIEAGVDIPYLLYNLVVNEAVEQIFNYKIGTKWRWFFPQDLLWFLTAQDRASSLKSFFSFIDNDLHYAAMSLSDLGPSLGIIMQSLRFITNKERRNFMFKRGW